MKEDSPRDASWTHRLGMPNYPAPTRSDSEESKFRLELAFDSLQNARGERDSLNERIREELLPAYEKARRSAKIYGHEHIDTEGETNGTT